MDFWFEVVAAVFMGLIWWEVVAMNGKLDSIKGKIGQISLKFRNDAR